MNRMVDLVVGDLLLVNNYVLHRHCGTARARHVLMCFCVRDAFRIYEVDS